MGAELSDARRGAQRAAREATGRVCGLPCSWCSHACGRFSDFHLTVCCTAVRSVSSAWLLQHVGPGRHKWPDMLRQLDVLSQDDANEDTRFLVRKNSRLHSSCWPLLQYCVAGSKAQEPHLQSCTSLVFISQDCLFVAGPGG